MAVEKLYPLLMIVLAIVIFISFFLPWVGVESAPVGTVSKLLTGKQQAVINDISGYMVPVLANSSESRLMITIIQLFNPGIKNADKKSYLIWAIPILSVIIAGAVLVLGKNKWVNLAIAILGIAIFSVAAYKITTTNLDKLVLQVRIGYGLWLILYGYLAMGILAAIVFAKEALIKKS